MPRSLRAWLASLALIACPTAALPSTARAQTFLGPPHLAPVALEARCTLVDGLTGALTGSLAGLTALGGDPLERAILRADSELDASLERLAAEEPVDMACSAPAAPVAGNRGDAMDAVIGCGVLARDRDTLCCEELAHSEDCARTQDDSRCDPIVAVEEKSAVDDGARFVGGSPVITLLNEEYLPYDLGSNEPLRLRLLPFSVRRSCPLENRPTAAAAAPEPAAIALEDVLPSRSDLVALGRWFRQHQPPMPLDCWLHEVVWQVNDALAPHGPIRSQLQAEQIGSQIARLGIQVEENLRVKAQPVMPILARVPAARPVAAPAGAAPAPVAQQLELAFAAEALHSAAGGLENVAAALRSWGSSLDRVAQSPLRTPTTLHR